MEERRKGDRRQLYGKPFLAMLIGGLPEDRRKGERRRTAIATIERRSAGTVETVRNDLSEAGEADAAT
ncbi:MAG TPA: hypothetical protein VHS78_15415 [Candidatus Elarobacter sp.]|jgi:hypothetical protein|nr:hypothetical protein [Candidatus Elarobacter sp.]